MKVGEFQKHIAAFGILLEAGNAKPMAREINRLSTIFNGHETMMIAKFVKLATPPQNIPIQSHGILLSDILQLLRELEVFLRPCSKQTYLTDLKSFNDLLGTAKKTSVTDFIEIVKTQLAAKPTVKKRKPTQLNQELVDEYVARLKADYKESDSFKIIYEELRTNKAVRKQEAAAISDKFAYATPPSTAKKASLERILSVHEHYHSSVLREKAMGGRSAA